MPSNGSNVYINDAGGLSMLQRSSRLAMIPGYNDLIGSDATSVRINAESSRSDIENYIRSAAEARGIDPDIAVKVAKAEGLNPVTKATEAWQSTAKKNGEREPSYTPFQLLVGEGSKNFGPGLGDEFIRETGLDPRDPNNVQASIDYALDYAAENGWGSWYGAARAGVGKNDGIDGARAIGINAPIEERVAPGELLASMQASPIPQDRPRGNPDAVGLARLVPADSATRFGMTYVHPGQELRDPGLAGILSETANRLGTDLVIQSGFRGPDHPIEAAKPTGPGEHSRSAADINMAGMSTDQKKDLIVTLRELGANRFIAYSKSPNLLHVDMKDQRGDGSAYFMFDRTAKNNAISKAPQWYQDAAKEATGVKVAGLPAASSSGGLIPTPSDRPGETQIASAPATIPAQRPAQPTAESFRDRYIEPKQEPGLGGRIAAGAIDIGAGLIPGVGMAATAFNTGAAVMGKPTIGERIVANAGQQSGSPIDQSLFSSPDDSSDPIRRRVAKADEADDPVTSFEGKYIRGFIYEGDWLTPGEKWGQTA